jgi:hypothetical protein
VLRWIAPSGHDERFPPRRLSGGCGVESGQWPSMLMSRRRRLLGQVQRSRPVYGHAEGYKGRHRRSAPCGHVAVAILSSRSARKLYVVIGSGEHVGVSTRCRFGSPSADRPAEIVSNRDQLTW